jgi:hypothetical protein
MASTDLSADAARELIAAAEGGRERGDALSKNTWLGPVLSVFIGLLMGAFLMASIYLLPVATPLEAAIISGSYLAGILLAVGVYNLGRKVTARGWIDRYQMGLAISCGIFFVAVALSFLISERSLLLWAPLSVATVLPIAIFGTKRPAR